MWKDSETELDFLDYDYLITYNMQSEIIFAECSYNRRRKYHLKYSLHSGWKSCLKMFNRPRECRGLCEKISVNADLL